MNAVAFAGLPGGSEVFLVIFVILLLFGAKKLPELSRSLGRSLGEFKKGKEDLEREIRDAESDFKQAVSEPDKSVDSETKSKSDSEKQDRS